MTPRDFDLAVSGFKERDKMAHQKVALLCAVIANAHQGKGGKRFKVEDFMPREKEREQSPEDMQAAILQWARMHNNKLKREGKLKKE